MTKKENNCRWLDGLDDNGDPFCAYPEFEGPCDFKSVDECGLKGAVNREEK